MYNINIYIHPLSPKELQSKASVRRGDLKSTYAEGYANF